MNAAVSAGSVSGLPEGFDTAANEFPSSQDGFITQSLISGNAVVRTDAADLWRAPGGSGRVATADGTGDASRRLRWCPR